LDSALDSCQWDLSKDLVRFLKAIGKKIWMNTFILSCTKNKLDLNINMVCILDPNDADSPKTSCVFPKKYSIKGQGSTVNPNEEDLSFLMGNIQVDNKTKFFF